MVFPEEYGYFVIRLVGTAVSTVSASADHRLLTNRLEVGNPNPGTQNTNPHLSMRVCGAARQI